MKKILVSEDEQNIREFIVINLKRVGYTTVEASCGDEALKIYEEQDGDFDIAILDIMTPGRHDGLSVCKELRKKSDSLGIIMLSAKTQEMDKISGLMMGADDYMTKPFSPSELLARVDAIYRRVELSGGKKKDFKEEVFSGDFKLNFRTRSFFKKNVVIELTQVEFQIMEYFFANPKLSLSRTDILHHVWGTGYAGEEKIVDVNIRRLRMKIEEEPSTPAYIVTVWGHGYRWEG
ncbi:MAG: response regulator transcription factor [Clostridia bacterium]